MNVITTEKRRFLVDSDLKNIQSSTASRGMIKKQEILRGYEEWHIRF